MSEPDSTPRRQPPTIDLTAQEVETDAKAKAQDSANADSAARAEGGRGSHLRPYTIGILTGTVAIAAIGVGLWLAGLVPARETGIPNAPIAQTVAVEEVSSKLDKIQQVLQTPRADESLVARMAGAEAQAKALGDSLAALTRRVDAGTVEAKSASTTAEEAKRAAQASVQHADVEALADRIATLESAIKSLRADVAQHAANADDSAARAVVAAEALRAAVERGAPYQAELAAVKSLGADQSAVAALEPFAADGIPTAASLGRELTTLVPALERASEPQSDDGSFVDRLESRARRLVRITPLNVGAATAAGDDAVVVTTRIEADAVRGDIVVALADLARLPEAARAPAAAWIKKAQARQAALTASERIAADALTAIAKPGSQ